MDEILTRLELFFDRLAQQVQTAVAGAEAGRTLTAVLEAVLPAACGILRVLAVLVALAVLSRCILSLFREKPGKEIWGWLTMNDGTRFDLRHWENTVGRGRRSDVLLDFPTISRSHLALLRDDKGNWKLQPLQTKNGTRVNGKKAEHTVPIKTGDIIELGGLPLDFYAISEAEEQEQAMRWGVAERPLSPARTLVYLTVFQLMMCVQCLPGRETGAIAMIALTFFILTAAMWAMYALYRSLKRTAYEAETLAFFLCTISFSITAAYSPEDLLVQAISMLLGIIGFLTLSVLLRDLKATVSLRWPIAVLTCLLLIFNVVLGQQIFGAKNWINLGFVSFQPSELVKVAFLFTGAATLDRLFAKRNLIFTVLFCGFCMGCLALMSDFGTALIFFVALLVIAFLRSGDVGFLALMGTAAAAGGWMILQFKPYILNRFMAWRHVWEYSMESGGYQQTRTMSAIASGGLFGKGTEGAFLKNLGAANTDLVFGVISEEFGLILALMAVFVLLVLAVYAVRCASTARSSYYVIAANSAAAMLIFQASLNVLGAVDILPLTGVTLPFVSMGGSSMISCWGLLAFIKAADTRPNASFTIKLPKRIRGWIPPDAEGIYNGWDAEYEDYYDYEDANRPDYGGPAYEDGYTFDDYRDLEHYRTPVEDYGLAYDIPEDDSPLKTYTPPDIYAPAEPDPLDATRPWKRQDLTAEDENPFANLDRDGYPERRDGR